MDVDEALRRADQIDDMFAVPTVDGVLAAEVRRLQDATVIVQCDGPEHDEIRELRAMRARAQHLAEHHPDPSAAGAARQILGRS